ncbi:hypothetical protein ACLEPN_20180 [Myxococcus sp. 1LA]
MRGLAGAVLAIGLLMGCGGIEDAADAPAAHGSDARGEVEAMACNDCGWIYQRCMRNAPTIEQAEACEESRLLCEFTFCPCPGLGCPSAQAE